MAELASQSEKVSVVCDHPQGLRDELAEHIEASNMETTMMQEGSFVKLGLQSKCVPKILVFL